MEDLKAIHDELMAGQPSGAEHDSENCPFCANSTISPGEGGDMTRTYSQDELDAAVADAISSLEGQIKDLKASVEQSEVEARISQLKAEMEDQIKELQSQLDTAVLEATKAKQEYADLVAWLDTEKQSAEQAAELASRREERLAKVREVASFPEDYLEANADRWAAMSDEDFASAVSDWQTISSKNDDGLPNASTMNASRTESSTGGRALVREVLHMRFQGIDPRTV